MIPDLFGGGADREPKGPPRPLADRMRPASFDEFVGQEGLLGEGSPLKKLIDTGAIPSLIFWGPPGSGKTTLARLIAGSMDFLFIEVSAVTAGIADLRAAIGRAREEWKARGRRTILFIDEVHRFSKVQQDATLPYVEKGEIIVIGSTTENPAFEVIPSLRSRCRIYRLDRLSFGGVLEVIRRALADEERGLGKLGVEIGEAALNRIAETSGGDARVALNLLEAAALAAPETEGGRGVDVKLVDELARDTAILYDKMGQEHFDHASAFQKSLRGSDPDAAIYWLAKMIAGGEDPRFIARRLIVTASEDVGMADPSALLVAMAAAEAVDRVGLPEARIPLAQAVIHIACASKSNSAITAMDKALADIEKEGLSRPVPDHLKDTHYKDAKKFGFGKGYKYPHSYPGHWVGQRYLPQELAGRRYYEPSDQGREKAAAERLEAMRKKGKGGPRR
ncbi:MAG: replication-associated recombination protein A [Candidatus Nitrospinota bacterium M3_3B_026]